MNARVQALIHQARIMTAEERLAKAKEWVATVTGSSADEQTLDFIKTAEGWRANYDLKEKAEAPMRAMNGAVTASVTDLHVVPADPEGKRYSDSIAMGVAFANKTNKDIAGIKGTVRFADMFDATIKNVEISHDEGLKAGATTTWNGEMELNQFMDEDKKLARTPLEKMKTNWSPQMIIFTDGSKLTLAK